ncbi:MAG: NAD-dependent epimerase/dehydratase family protein [Lewinellaceae bacterium]|nr:NAD-dependent epimerase/dehydratase family protein [Lewinellaceae bacterium]
MKTAVTGASGRIGNLLVRRLLEEGHEVRVLVHRTAKGLEYLPVDVVWGSILEPNDLDQLVKGCEVVYHLAAVISILSGISEQLRRVNIEGTNQVLQAARRQKVRRVVYFSTVHAFLEEGPEVLFDESRPLALQTRMPYSRTKAEALDLALRFSSDNNTEVVALCPTGVLGPCDPEPSLSGKMLIDFYRGNIPMLAPGGFDWVDVRDITDAALAAIHLGAAGKPIYCRAIMHPFPTSPQLHIALPVSRSQKWLFPILYFE